MCMKLYIFFVFTHKKWYSLITWFWQENQSKSYQIVCRINACIITYIIYMYTENHFKIKILLFVLFFINSIDQ